jgi:hypothetical protein
VGGFLGIGGASYKTDRKVELNAMQGLSNVFNFALPQAKPALASGNESLSEAGGFWSKLLSGNRAATGAAVAPETNAALAKSDAAKRQLATSGTSRGGGTASVNQQRDTDVMSKVDNLLFGARKEAAGETAKIGGAQLSEAGNLLGVGTTAESNLADISAKARKDDYAMNQDMVGKVTGALDQALTAIFA